jgi:hypothetical protein
MARLSVLAAVAIGVTVQASAAAWAGDIPFTITSTGLPNGGVACTGPWLRESGCGRIGPDGADKSVFYTAEDTLFSPYGAWGCDVHREGCGTKRLDIVRFCLKKDRPAQVNLVFDGTKLSVNADASCSSALAASVLGQDGEDAETARDTDAYLFKGQSGENVEVVLDIDGAAGGVNGDATLRVLDPPSSVLAQKKGRLPLRVNATLSGEAVIQVIRDGSASAFRGFYTVEVIPASGIGQRLLRPTNTVEQ